MTEKLIEKIKVKFPNNKIMIFSNSWGSILSAKLLERNPYAVDGVVACGQIIKNVTVDNFQGKDLQLISSALRKYTNAYQNRIGEKDPMGTIIKGLLRSPDYKMKDFKAIMVNEYMKNTSLWKEIIRINLTEQLRNVKVPYIMLQGDTNTGHRPGVKMMDTLLTVLKECSLQE